MKKKKKKKRGQGSDHAPWPADASRRGRGTDTTVHSIVTELMQARKERDDLHERKEHRRDPVAPPTRAGTTQAEAQKKAAESRKGPMHDAG